MSKYYVVGDIHGRFQALVDVLKRSRFDFNDDTLVSLGDIVDGGFYSNACIELLTKIKNHILILGNHDAWFLHWTKTGAELPVWYHQGGMYTIMSYNNDYKSVPKSHITMLTGARPYYIDDKKRIFVHGGFDILKSIETQDPYDIMWDRSLINVAHGWEEDDGTIVPGIEIPGYHMVFVGHTTTQHYGGSLLPLRFNNLMMMDTGAGWSGRLTLMNIDTLQFFQSNSQIDPYHETYDSRINDCRIDLDEMGLIN